jgi:hypothetical protein
VLGQQLAKPELIQLAHVLLMSTLMGLGLAVGGLMGLDAKLHAQPLNAVLFISAGSCVVQIDTHFTLLQITLLIMTILAHILGVCGMLVLLLEFLDHHITPTV